MKFFPENASSYGSDVDFIFWLITGVITVASIIVIFLILYPILTKNKTRTREERYKKGIGFKELKLIYLGIFLLAVADFYFLYQEGPIWSSIEESLPEKDLHVIVMGRQWLWEFTYPGPDGKLYTDDDVKSINQLYIPVNKTVHMDIQSYDVLHSVFIPNARFKQDALPGRNITRWVKMTKTGKFPLTCAEICGIGHANMKATITVLPEKDFEKQLAKLYKK